MIVSCGTEFLGIFCMKRLCTGCRIALVNFFAIDLCFSDLRFVFGNRGAQFAAYLFDLSTDFGCSFAADVFFRTKRFDLFLGF